MPDDGTPTLIDAPRVLQPARPAGRSLRALAALAAGLALALLLTVWYGLRHGGGGLPVVAESTTAPSHAEVLRFLDDWSEAANARDASRLRSLGFELPPEELEREFPSDGGKLEMVLLSEQPVGADRVALRLRLIYTERLPDGVERRERERSVVLRSEGATLRYAGIWE